MGRLLTVLGKKGGFTLPIPTPGNVWENIAIPNSRFWTCGVWDGSKYLALANTGFQMTSTDGENWTQTTNNITTQATEGIAYGNGVYVAVGAGGTLPPILRSTDGVNWTRISTAFDASSYGCVIWDGTKFIATANSNAISGAAVIHSTDGLTWSGYSAPASSTNRDIVYAEDKGLYVMANSSVSVYSSPDAQTWMSRAISGSGWWGMAYSTTLGRFVTVSSSATNRVAYSDDGINWITVNVPAYAYRRVAWGDNMYVAASTDGKLIVSPDGITWTEKTVNTGTYRFTIFGDHRFIVLPWGSATLLMSKE